MEIQKLRNIGIKSKLILLLVVIWFLYGVADFAIQRFVIYPSFVALEEDEAEKNLLRCVQAINREVHHLDALAYDWSAWDDTYNFVNEPNKHYVDVNLTPATFVNTKLNIICICDTSGKVVWGKLYNAEKTRHIDIKDLESPSFSGLKGLLHHKTLDSSFSGVLFIGKDAVMLASRPIITSADGGPIRGTLFMGRFLDEGVIDTLSKQTQVDFKVINILQTTEDTGKEVEGILTRLTPNEQVLIEKKENGFLWIYTKILDVNGQPALLVKVESPMKISEKGASTILYAALSTIASVFIILVVMLFISQRAVIRPITHLTRHILSIGTSGDLSTRLSLRRDDEIGALANEFDKMLEQLEGQNKELEMLSIELVDDITRRQEAEAKLKREIEERERLATHREELLEELNQKNKILENLAISDSLTGLFNHKYIIERLGKEIAEARRYGNHLSIIMLDIDHFKKVNDTYGHQVGDDILLGVSNIIQETLREVDIAGRYGGEEFLLILTYTDLQGAIICARRIRENIERMSWQVTGLKVTISAGVASLGEENSSRLVEKADLLMYKAKSGGRNRIEF